MIPIVGNQKTTFFVEDDGHPKRTGTVCSASVRIITAVIGSWVLSLAWATAQLGWIGAPMAMLFFAFTTYFTSTRLAACYRYGDPTTTKRNYTYMDAVKHTLGDVHANLFRLFQYLNFFCVGIGYTIASARSMMAIPRSNCFHNSGKKHPCHMNINPYIISFGVIQLFISQIPNFDKLSWLSIITAFMPFLYSSVCIGLGFAKVAENGKLKGSMTGIKIGIVTEKHKTWRLFKALGIIAFSYSSSKVHFEVQDTLKSPPSEEKTMKKALLVSNVVTTLWFMLCGFVGYAAFGDMSPNNILTDFGFHNPYWLLDMANFGFVIHLIREYQVSCQPIFAFIEKQALVRFPASEFMARDVKFRIPGFNPTSFNIFRTVFVMITTLISMIIPFFDDVIGFVGALEFWPLTVYFPVMMYIEHEKIPKWSKIWICLHIFNLACLMVTISAAAGSVAGVVFDFKPYKPFNMN